MNAATAAEIAALLWQLNYFGEGRPIRETNRIVERLRALGHDFGDRAG